VEEVVAETGLRSLFRDLVKMPVKEGLLFDQFLLKTVGHRLPGPGREKAVFEDDCQHQEKQSQQERAVFFEEFLHVSRYGRVLP